MLGRLILLFLLTPAVELGLLIQVDKLIGFWPTIGLIIVTGMAGSYLAKREGLSVWKNLNDRLNAGGLPGKELLDGVIILVAGALLITPGVLTDVFGFIGLIPFTRALVRKGVMKRIKKKMSDGSLQMQFGVFGGAGPMGYDSPMGYGEPGVQEAEWEPASPSESSSEKDRERESGGNGVHREVPGRPEEFPKSGTGRNERDSV
jgi:UPF0716 protein FxsA